MRKILIILTLLSIWSLNCSGQLEDIPLPFEKGLEFYEDFWSKPKANVPKLIKHLNVKVTDSDNAYCTVLLADGFLRQDRNEALESAMLKLYLNSEPA